MTGGVASFNASGNVNFLAAQNCNQAVITSGTYTWKGDWWVGDLFSYSHTAPPNSKSCWYADVPGRPYSGIASVVSSASRHPGGSNTAFCDGSVKFIKSTVNITTWNAAGNEEWERGDQRRFLLIDPFSRWVKRFPKPAGRLIPATNDTRRRRSARRVSRYFWKLHVLATTGQKQIGPGQCPWAAWSNGRGVLKRRG